MAGGTEEEGIVVRAERLVFRVDGDGVRGLVLIGEGHIVFHAVTGLEDGPDLGESLLKEGFMLRRDGDDEVAGAIGVTHIGGGLHEVFRDGGTDFAVGIAVELDHALGLAAVAEAFVGEDPLQDVLGGCIAEDGISIEGEFADPGDQLRGGGVGREVLPFLQRGETGEDVLEHARGGAGGRHELALAGDLSTLVVADGVRQDTDAPLRCGRSHDLHPGKSLLEMLNLLLHATEAGTPPTDLVDIFLVKHSSLVIS